MAESTIHVLPPKEHTVAISVEITEDEHMQMKVNAVRNKMSARAYVAHLIRKDVASSQELFLYFIIPTIWKFKSTSHRITSSK